MRVGIAADHAGYHLKGALTGSVVHWGYEVVDFGACKLDPDDDYPGFIIPMANPVASNDVQRGIGICGSGIGVSVAANKIAGIRAWLINNVFSAHQGVEDHDMNILCLGGDVIGVSVAIELVKAFLSARFVASECHLRRQYKVQQ